MKNGNKYVKLLLLLWFLFLAMLVIVVIYFSLHLKGLAENDLQQNNRINLNAQQIAEINVLLKNLSEQQKVPGPQGEQGIAGKDGKNATSVQTEVFRDVPKNGEKGDPLRYEDLTAEQKAELRGADALRIELCRQRGTLDLGWRYVGMSLCLPIEVAE